MYLGCRVINLCIHILAELLQMRLQLDAELIELHTYGIAVVMGSFMEVALLDTASQGFHLQTAID